MAKACNVPVEQVTVTKFVGAHAVFGSLIEEEFGPDRNGWWRDAGG
jgi:hypothetical protein